MHTYTEKQLSMIKFPLGGIGAGSICFQGTGSIGAVSVRNVINLKNDPQIFAAITVKGEKNLSRVVEAPVPGNRIQGYYPESSTGLGDHTFGLPRFSEGEFSARFPFATLKLSEDTLPVNASITAWSPFVPGDEDASSLPFAALEYTFENKTDAPVEAVFYFASDNFLHKKDSAFVRVTQNGFCLEQPALEENHAAQASFSIESDRPCFVDAAWVRGGWYDKITMLWNNIQKGYCENRRHNDDFSQNSPGASLAVPLSLAPRGKESITLRLSWYAPNSDLRVGLPPEIENSGSFIDDYHPWYSGQYPDIDAAAADWRARFDELRMRTLRFTDCFFGTDLPEEITEAIAANLCILKSPTVLRQRDGRFWGWEGCHEDRGSCHGSCTHVWNYQQALSGLFPNLERTLRETEFFVSQNEEGHQNFRTALPIQPTTHDFHAAGDGQLGGVIKTYREWRICGDSEWMKSLWPRLKDSLNYCIRQWDPEHEGVLKKAHHNTYDIEFWGADGMCTSFYLAALKAACEMGDFLGEDTAEYALLYQRGRAYMQEKLFNGEYFFQQVEYDMEELDYLDHTVQCYIHNDAYSPEIRTLIEAEGPRYQYGTGCISDGVFGIWLAEISGLSDIVDESFLRKNLESIYKYNFVPDLSAHSNPQRPGYALNHEGGLLLCTWPHGGKPSIPFIYSDEVWTGIEYQVASHLMMKGFKQEGLSIVRTLRARYDGEIRNPFSEFECGYWYARALASYGLIQGYFGVRYDAVEKALHISGSGSENFRTFLSTQTGFGILTVKDGSVSFEPAEGSLDIRKVLWEQ